MCNRIKAKANNWLPKKRRFIKIADTKICPYCAEDIKAEAIKCKHCQSMLNKGDDQQVSAVITRPAAPKLEKPIWQQWWAWVTALLILSAIIITFNNESLLGERSPKELTEEEKIEKVTQIIQEHYGDTMFVSVHSDYKVFMLRPVDLRNFLFFIQRASLGDEETIKLVKGIAEEMRVMSVETGEILPDYILALMYSMDKVVIKTQNGKVLYDFTDDIKVD